MTWTFAIAASHRRDHMRRDHDGAHPAPLFAVRLVDRRTGKDLSIRGIPLTAFSRRPEETAAEMLSGRDPRQWEARIEVLRRGRHH